MCTRTGNCKVNPIAGNVVGDFVVAYGLERAYHAYAAYIEKQGFDAFVWLGSGHDECCQLEVFEDGHILCKTESGLIVSRKIAHRCSAEELMSRKLLSLYCLFTSEVDQLSCFHGFLIIPYTVVF